MANQPAHRTPEERVKEVIHTEPNREKRRHPHRIGQISKHSRLLRPTHWYFGKVKQVSLTQVKPWKKRAKNRKDDKVAKVSRKANR